MKTDNLKHLLLFVCCAVLAAGCQPQGRPVSPRWSYSTNNLIFSAPAVSQDGTLFVMSDDATLHAILPDGSVKWKYKLDKRDQVDGLAMVNFATRSSGRSLIGAGGGLHCISPGGGME